MAELEILERLGTAAPPEERVRESARARLLASIAEEPPRGNGRGRRRRRLVLAAASGAVAVAIALAAWAATYDAGARVPGPSRGAVLVLVLAKYRFQLPRGFETRDTGCTPATTLPGAPETVAQGLRVAASADGGCLEVALASGTDVVPSGAQPVSVGAWNGEVLTMPNGGITLYVEIPTSTSSDYLVLSSTGLTEQQLISVAASGLPG